MYKSGDKRIEVIYSNQVRLGEVNCEVEHIEYRINKEGQREAFNVEFSVGVDEIIRVFEGEEVIYEGLATQQAPGIRILSVYNPWTSEEVRLLRRAKKGLTDNVRRIRNLWGARH